MVQERSTGRRHHLKYFIYEGYFETFFYVGYTATFGLLVFH